ncbi:MAG: hypothetical protein HYV35_03750 [Lentisphaerae bacterium]|nr:hypothetical protein [Lentisphaerota bacterium]
MKLHVVVAALLFLACGCQIDTRPPKPSETYLDICYRPIGWDNSGERFVFTKHFIYYGKYFGKYERGDTVPDKTSPYRWVASVTEHHVVVCEYSLSSGSLREVFSSDSKVLHRPLLFALEPPRLVAVLESGLQEISFDGTIGGLSPFPSGREFRALDPLGRRAAFAVKLERSDHANGIEIIELASGSAHVLRTGLARSKKSAPYHTVANMAWSPDGHKIVFHHYRGNFDNVPEELQGGLVVVDINHASSTYIYKGRIPSGASPLRWQTGDSIAVHDAERIQSQRASADYTFSDFDNYLGPMRISCKASGTEPHAYLGACGWAQDLRLLQSDGRELCTLDSRRIEFAEKVNWRKATAAMADSKGWVW